MDDATGDTSDPQYPKKLLALGQAWEKSATSTILTIEEPPMAL